ncbi:alpha/beta hydrolase [Elioraea sp.]|uniref:alpha/beta hydrolase n=1 Tax=Elioraea sp. TaxID=2185103 RepID=UPI0025BBFDF0|nr:alpha/beta fold hydrolase [Elioraea sp.]
MAGQVLAFPRRDRSAPAETDGLELLLAGPEDQRPATLLFLHGAAAGAWVWAEHAMPSLAASGWRCAAVSFRGHGNSWGRGLLHTWGLLDYLADARAALDALDGPVIVVAHSLGALVAQMMLGDQRIRGMVLMAPVPAEGLAAANMRLAITDPLLWQEVARMPWLAEGVAPPARLRHALFGEAMEDGHAAAHLSRMQPESIRALAEAQWPRPVASARLLGVPTLVLGAKADPLVPPDAVLRTAWFHGADRAMLDRIGHAMMLDTGWEQPLALARTWIEGLDLGR